jgi:hypothetical protein
LDRERPGHFSLRGRNLPKHGRHGFRRLLLHPQSGQDGPSHLKLPKPYRLKSGSNRRGQLGMRQSRCRLKCGHDGCRQLCLRCTVRVQYYGRHLLAPGILMRGEVAGDPLER